MQEEKELNNALCKIGELQKKILLKVHEETEGDQPVKWAPSKWFGDSPVTGSKRVSFSKARRKLIDRNLIIDINKLSRSKRVKRTTYVKLTSLGRKAVERLKKQGEVVN